ncbi:hypothetical protein DFH28DRAFT_894943 [Melampsora americana]|nr:hypothetical protein DFH28DRAFT_894943 [Melampsora americana]
MIDRRSRHQDLNIPLQRLDLNISSPIPSTSAPLIDVPDPIEPQMTDPPSPIHEDLDFPQTVYKPPFQLFEVSESSEVKLSRPFEFFDTSDPNFSRSRFCALNVDEDIIGFLPLN